MYITITPQKLGPSYGQSVSDFVAYLNKENDSKALDEHEHFFNQYGEQVSDQAVIKHIDGNTKKLKQKEPKFYSLTVNPSQRELQHIQKDAAALKAYTHAVMKDYAKAFHRVLDGRPVTLNDIVYYAKLEHERSYKGTDKAIRENAPYHKKIVALKRELVDITSGKQQGDVTVIQKQIQRLEQQAPHQWQGKRIQVGMAKPGAQSHIHIIVSRKDASNRFSLSPGSKYKASEVLMNGKMVKRGFDRDQFFKAAESTFDSLFNYRRNYVESYQARKLYLKQSQKFFMQIAQLPKDERTLALHLLKLSSKGAAQIAIPPNKLKIVLKAIKHIKRGASKVLEAGSIGI